MAKVKICLDAGHYGKYNRSPAVKSYYESDMNWKLHILLKKYLEQYGIEVIQTRSNQATDLGLNARGKASKGCDLFLSIHSNAVGNGVNESVDYPVVYVPLNGSGTEIGKKLATCIASTMGTKQKGEVKTKKGSGDWDYYGVIYGAVSVGVPGLILEHSFHTNTRSTKWLLDDNNLDKLARAEAAVIAAHYGIEKPVTGDSSGGETTPGKPETVLYRVQVGAYGVKANAEAMLAKLKAAGFNGIIKEEVTETVADPKPVVPETKPAEPVKKLEEGSIVRVKQGAKDYKGGSLASFVYNRNHTVKSVNGNRVVITFNGVVVAAVHKDNLILV